MLECLQFFTDTGQHRDKNEDAGGFFYNQTNQQLLVLCDGMGGHKAGDVARKFGTEVITSDDGTLAALLGASPGASTAVDIMFDVLQRCYRDEFKG
ncbi:malate:quinone oxidoreductase, partial [Staphylococcus aureus]|uniref:malate:quinone oxidoreductase n=1 Tax=Staphylococcus aureus TaxID=1280 RepID=UPI00210D86FC